MTRRARLRSVVLSLALVAQVVTVSTPVVAGDDGRGARDRATLAASSDGPVRIVEHTRTGRVRLVGAASGHTLGRPDGIDADDAPADAARTFVATHRRAFGLAAGRDDLRLRGVGAASRDAGTVVRFDQTHRGLPVLAGELVVRTDPANEILSVAGEVLPSVDVDTTPGLAADEAARIARRAIARDRGVDTAGLRTSEPRLSIFDRDLFGGPGLPMTRLVWQLEVAGAIDPALREYVVVDADTGALVVRFPLVHTAKNRLTCDNENTGRGSQWPPLGCTTGAYDPSDRRGEGDPPLAVPAVDEVHDLTGGVYDFFMGHFGRDSLDGAGMPLRSTVRWCYNAEPCPYANAFWSGTEMYYGEELGVDDVVGHELAHGVTQHTANLLYYYQSGAINESLSDLYGELFDLQTPGDDDVADRWLVGEQIDPSVFGGPLRDMQDPPSLFAPDRISSPHYWTAADDSGGVHTNSGVNNKAIYLLTDGDAFNGRTVQGLGAEKVLQLYYEVQTSLLTSGSDYADLADALEQACDNLVGTLGFTTRDCTQVARAVSATEMRAEPAGTTTLDAPACPAGTPLRTFADDVEDVPSLPGWLTTATGSGTPWTYDVTYATSGDHAFFGPDGAATGTSTLAMTTDVRAPSNAHLHFSHAFEFEPGAYDGGVVEYSTDGGTSWDDAAGLFDVNGPNGTISTADTNPLAGRSAFVNASGGYTASRADLSGLAGQDVRFRWVIGTDSIVAGRGWWVDDVEVYGCDVTAPAFPGGARLDVTDRGTDRVALSWPAATDDTGVVEYEVRVDGTPVATTTSRAHTVTGLGDATSHAFSVVARDGVPRSSTPLEVSATTLDGTAPTFPSGARLRVADVSGDRVSLVWPAATDNVGVDHLLLAVDGTVRRLAGDATSTVVEGVADGSTHDVRLVALDAAGNTSAMLQVDASVTPREVVRLAGEDRFETAVATSQDAFPAGAGTVFVATGRNFPDALAAGPVAGGEGAPILLVEHDAVPTSTADEIRRLGARDVVVLGGGAAVSPAVFDALSALVPGAVTRVQGEDRFATAVEVSRRGFGPDVPVAYVATGTNSPDALAAAAAAGRDRGPVLLVPGDAVPDVVADELQRLVPGRIVVLGGEAAIQESVVAQLAGFTSGGVTRIFGEDRYATGAGVAATFAADTDVVYVATGTNFPDALTGTPPAAQDGAPILLVPGDAAPASVASQLERIAPRRIVVLGGPVVVADDVLVELRGFLAA